MVLRFALRLVFRLKTCIFGDGYHEIVDRFSKQTAIKIQILGRYKSKFKILGLKF